MEPLFINLSEYNKLSRGQKRFFIFFGIASILLGTTSIVFYLFNDSHFFNYLSPIFIVILGIQILLRGYGFSFQRFMRYVKVDDDIIECNTTLISNKNRLSWSEITKIEVKPSSIVLIKDDKRLIKLSFLWISYKNVNLIKEVIYTQAKKKGIAITY